MRVAHFVAILFVFSIPAIVSAQMFKCTNDKGMVSFQQAPCSQNQTTQWQKKTKQEMQAEKEAKQRAIREKLQRDKEARELDERLSWYNISNPERLRPAIRSYLLAVLKDPESLRDLTMIQSKSNGKHYKIRVNYRARNGFGGYGISDQVFEITKEGKVIKLTKWTLSTALDW